MSLEFTCDLVPSGWTQSVEWIQGDVFAPETWRESLKGSTAVVHSLGLLMENDYKSWLGKSQAGHQASDTFEKINRDSVVLLANEAKLQGVGAFLFISSGRTVPFLDERYTTTKREAENALLSDQNLRAIVFRPRKSHFALVLVLVLLSSYHLDLLPCL